MFLIYPSCDRFQRFRPTMFESERVSPRSLIVGALSFIAVTVILTLLISRVGPERIRAVIAQAGIFGPLLYIGLRALTYIVAPLSTGPMLFASAAMFGAPEAIVYSIVGETLGGCVNFGLARRFGRPVVSRLVGRDGMPRVEKFYRLLSSPWVLVYARLFLFSIYDFISYAAGLTALKFREYVVISLFVGLVPTIGAILIGSTLTGDLRQLIGMYAVLAVVSVVTFLLFGRIRRLLKLDAPLPTEPVDPA